MRNETRTASVNHADSVLVADDDSDFRSLMAYGLRLGGHQVVECASSDELVRRLARSPWRALVVNRSMAEFDKLQPSLEGMGSTELFVINGRTSAEVPTRPPSRGSVHLFDDSLAVCQLMDQILECLDGGRPP